MEIEAVTSLTRILLISMLAKLATKLRLSNRRNLNQKKGGLSLRYHYGSIAEAHNAQHLYFNDYQLSQLGLVANLRSTQFQPSCRCSDTVDDALRMDLENYMPGDILVKTDRASMSNGLELRTPFLDVDFASFCVSLPSRLKIDSTCDKLILRKAYSDMWPKLINSRRKQGFGAPISQWLERDSIESLKYQYLNNRNKKIFGLISFKQSREIVKKNDYQTWILLNLALWMEKHQFLLGK